MSDSNSIVPGTVMGDGEPSMEDILASIRKVIASDKDVASAQGGAQTLEFESGSVIENDSADDILDLVSFVDEHAEPSQDVISATESVHSDVSAKDHKAVENSAFDASVLDASGLDDDGSDMETLEMNVDAVGTTSKAEVGFDESLDLVMDAEASDYLTTRVDREPESASASEARHGFGPDTLSDLEREPHSTKQDVVREEHALELSAVQNNVRAEDTLEGIGDIAALDDGEERVVGVEVASKPAIEDDMDLVKSLLSDLMDEPDLPEDEDDGADSAQEAFSEDKEMDAQGELAHENDEATDVAPESDVDSEDLLMAADRQDVAQDTVQDTVQDMVQDTVQDKGDVEDDMRSVLDDLLQDNINEEALGAAIEAEMNAELDLTSPDLSDIAKEAAQKTAIESPDIDNPDDEVVLEKPDVKGQFALLAGVAAMSGGAVVAGVAAAEVEQDVADENQGVTDENQGVADDGQGVEVAAEKAADETQMDETIDTDTDSQAKVKSEPEEQTQLQSELEEEQPMATRASKPKLVDEETERETGEVFASLSVAVKEQTKLEESGPPIGDLVQEALKPMLQEWLDKNLKGIVERVVKAEVKRIASQK